LDVIGISFPHINDDARSKSHLTSCSYVQGVSGGRMNILKRNNIRNCEK